MADIKKRVSINVEGEFFVDTTCINCDTWRQLAPETFGEWGDYSFVYAQPQTDGQRRKAVRALLACPTGSIGTRGRNNSREVRDDFPLPFDGGVYYCGFNSPKSYGGNSYFVVHGEGNWLIDSPKFLPHLVSKFEELGGIKYIFLTHRDDVADARKYAQVFRSQRIIHRKELEAQPDAEIVIEGEGPRPFAQDFVAIPTPGHTRGHCVLLYRDQFLFAGDHLAWSRADNRLEAHEDVCWYSWLEQVKSIEKLLAFRFEWVLPGHGQRIKLPAHAMQRELAALAERTAR